jgi:cytochrome c-type biogenesis protein CcmE
MEMKMRSRLLITLPIVALIGAVLGIGLIAIANIDIEF